MKIKGEGEQRIVRVREWMVKTFSPFPVIARGRKNDARAHGTKKPTVGELLKRTNNQYIINLY